jgi:hypothetical protein
MELASVFPFPKGKGLGQQLAENENRRFYLPARKKEAAVENLSIATITPLAAPMPAASTPYNQRRHDLFPNRQIWSRGADFRTLAGLGLKRFAWYGVLDSEV